MVKKEAVTEATLEAKEWEGELDDADLTAVSGGNITTDLVNSAKAVGNYYATLGKGIGDYFKAEFSYNNESTSN